MYRKILRFKIKHNMLDIKVLVIFQERNSDIIKMKRSFEKKKRKKRAILFINKWKGIYTF